MSKIRTPNRIRSEDFPDEFKPVAEKLAGLNDFQDDVVSVVNGRIDYENLNRQKAQFDVNTDASGVIIAPPQLKLNLRSKPYGINVVRLDNINDPGTYPNYMPLLVFSFNEAILTINTIKGLTPNAKYRFYIEIIGV